MTRTEIIDYLLTPQPPTVRTDASEPVIGMLLDELRLDEGIPPEVGEMAAHVATSRRQLGREKYGIDLYTHSGRDFRSDLFQELSDAVNYSFGAGLEHPEYAKEFAEIAGIQMVLMDRVVQLVEKMGVKS